MILEDIVDSILFHMHGLSKHEEKLLRNQSYSAKSTIKWKRSSNLSWGIAKKVLDNITIFDGQKVRQVITSLVNSNPEIFNKSDCYIAAFGAEAKSGGNICYDFRRMKLVDNKSFKNVYELSSVPTDSTIIFVDDLIGTGKQSLKYINNRLNLILKPSHKTYLLSICATPEGIENIESNSNFKVLTGVKLDKENFQFTDNDCNTFSPKEKTVLNELNHKLNPDGRNDYNKGLLLAFYNSTPNNCMPIIWRDKQSYQDSKNKSRKWVALLPRDFG